MTSSFYIIIFFRLDALETQLRPPNMADGAFSYPMNISADVLKLMTTYLHITDFQGTTVRSKQS